MKRRIPYVLLFATCAALITAFALQLAPAEIPAPANPAKVTVEGTSKKMKRGKTFIAQVRVDLTGVNALDGSQPAALGSYVIPISFDRNVLEFVSAGDGDSAAFASAPVSVTNAQTANANGVVTLVGMQTTSDAVTGTIGVASVRFRVIATEKGNTTLSISPELASPGLSLASTARQPAMSEPNRIAAIGLSSSFKIK